MENILKLGTTVGFEIDTLKGEGLIKGIGLNQEDMGIVYIIESLSLFSEDYPYTSILCPWSYLTVLENSAPEESVPLGTLKVV